MTSLLELELAHNALTEGIFETGAYVVPSKSQIQNILGQEGSFSTQCSRIKGPNEFMRSSFLPKCQPKITKISALP